MRSVRIVILAHASLAFYISLAVVARLCTQVINHGPPPPPPPVPGTGGPTIIGLTEEYFNSKPINAALGRITSPAGCYVSHINTESL